MKHFFLLMLFCQVVLGDSNQKVNLRILDSKLIDGQYISVEVKNNSSLKYCFVVDTSFYINNRSSTDHAFDNFTIALLENNTGVKIASSKEVNNHRRLNDSIVNSETRAIEKKNDTLFINERALYKKLYDKGFVSTLGFYKIEPGESFQLKIPFNLIIKYLDQGVCQYYEIDRSKKYYVEVQYLITTSYIEKYIPEGKIDSLEKIGYKFFTGKIVSQKIPLVLR